MESDEWSWRPFFVSRGGIQCRNPSLRDLGSDQDDELGENSELKEGLISLLLGTGYSTWPLIYTSRYVTWVVARTGHPSQGNHRCNGQYVTYSKYRVEYIVGCRYVSIGRTSINFHRPRLIWRFKNGQQWSGTVLPFSVWRLFEWQLNIR